MVKFWISTIQINQWLGHIGRRFKRLCCRREAKKFLLKSNQIENVSIRPKLAKSMNVAT